MTYRTRLLLGAATFAVLLMTARRTVFVGPTSVVRLPGHSVAALTGAGGAASPGVVAGPIRRNASAERVLLGDGLRVRYDTAGNPVSVHLSKSIEQLQAVTSNTSQNAPMMPDFRNRQSRALASGSFDPAGLKSSSFESAGSAWIVLRIPRSNPVGTGGLAVWELHPNGLRNPGVSIMTLVGS